MTEEVVVDARHVAFARIRGHVCVDTNQHLLQEGKTTDEINAMSDEELAQELEKDGVAPDVQGMDTAKQLRRVNSRVKMREDQLGGPLGDNDWSGLKNESGRHGEIKAADDQLKQIEANEGRPATPDDLNDIQVHNERIPGGKSNPMPDDAMPRCDHCRGILDGVQTTPELDAAERGMDESSATRFGPDEPTPDEGPFDDDKD